MKRKPNVVAIIQARMRSTRLPGKVLMPLNGLPVLYWMLKRVSAAEMVDRIIIATTWDESNRLIRRLRVDVSETACQIERPWRVFSYPGEEDDVIGRMISAAKSADADIVVEITADCPMIDPRHIDVVVNQLIMHNADYISNDVVERSWPDGLDVQAYWIDALMRCDRIVKPAHHCGWNIGASPMFNKLNWQAPPQYNWPQLGLTLDTAEDYGMLCFLFKRFAEKNALFCVEDIIDFLKFNSEYITNAKVKRKGPDEG